MVGRVALKLSWSDQSAPVVSAWRVGVFNLCPYKRDSHTSHSSAQTTAAGSPLSSAEASM
jgi:hypothetical protein